VEEMIYEFEIVEFNDYLDQVRDFRKEDGNME